MNLPVRYRPQRLEELVGQDGVARVLHNALARKRVAPVYLFAGPRGVGKTTTARILAKALNCERGVTPEPCGVCTSCVSIQQGRSLSVVEMDAASNRGIDDIREIREKVHVLPPDGRYKVYIIDEAHMLTREAFNALLKTLEEPPPHVVFVLATTEPQRIPETVQSRAQRLDFRPIPVETMVRRLLDVATREGMDLTPEGAREIARHARGGLRDALRLLELAALHAEGSLDRETVRRALGLPPQEVFQDLLQALEAGDVARAWAVVDRGQEQGLMPRDWINGLAELLEMRMEKALREGGEDESRLLAWSRFLLEYDALYRHTRFDTLLFRYTLYRMARASYLTSLKAWTVQGGYPHRDAVLHQPPRERSSPPGGKGATGDAAPPSEPPSPAPPPEVRLPEVFRSLETDSPPAALVGVLATCGVEEEPDRVRIRYRNDAERAILERHLTDLERAAGKPVVLEHDRARARLFEALKLEEVDAP